MAAKEYPSRYGPKGPRKKPGDTLAHSQGYVREYAPDHPRANNGYVFQHLLVWERARGPLARGLQVHHMNGARDDNRLENLEAVTAKEHRARHADVLTPEFVEERARRSAEARYRKGSYKKPCDTCGELHATRFCPYAQAH